MDEHIPDFGSGSYWHTDQQECGVHQIQRDPKSGDINVMWTNTSDPKG